MQVNDETDWWAEEVEKAEQHLKEKRNGRIFTVEFHHQYSSFLPNMNWRDFTIFHLGGETNNYSRYLEVNLAILGLHFSFNWWRDN